MVTEAVKLDKPIMTKTGKEAAELDRPDKTGPKCEGTIYHDHSSNGIKNGRRVFKNCWRAEITIDGQRYRHRGQDRIECEQWLKAIKENINPCNPWSKIKNN